MVAVFSRAAKKMLTIGLPAVLDDLDA